MIIQRGRHKGFSLIETLIAILVLSTGMLALAALQSGITRNSVSAKVRSQAVAAANDVLERIRERATRDQAGYVALDSQPLTDWVQPAVGISPIQPQRFQSRVMVTRLTPRSTPAECGRDVPPCLRVAVGVASGPPGNAEVKRVDVQVVWVDDAGLSQVLQISDLIPYAPRSAQDGLMQPSGPVLGPSTAPHQP
ncbi:MAG: prepilin-type N-terminal cleavage/methylation domain-containing protein [Ahniella sp.]|nr:prepilin-type N-terminal cleavage/methylation domain-containing protein [Ahniella sp.]